MLLSKYSISRESLKSKNAFLSLAAVFLKFCQLLTLPTFSRNSADPFNLKMNHGRLEIIRNFFSVRVIESWNKVPSDLKSETKNVVFRSKYKTLRALPMQPAARRVEL